MVARRLRLGRATVLLTAAVVVMMFWGCSSDSNSTGPAVGNLGVTALTTGANIDPDGYVVLTDSTSQSIAVNGTVMFEDLTEGSHLVELTQVAGNCTVDGQNPRVVTVTAGDNGATTFHVTCAPLRGDVQVTAATVGTDIDPDGYTVGLVTPNGTLTQSIGVNGSVTFNDLVTGDRTLELSGLARNCAVTGQNPRTVTVVGNETVETIFDVACDPIAGDLTVNASSSGEDIPSDYTVVVDGNQSQSVGANAGVTFVGLAEGDHTVELTDIAVNCTVTGANPRTVNVPFDETVETTFEVQCTADVGDLQVNASSSGADVPAGYTVVVDGTLTQDVGANGSVVFGDLVRGDHDVLLVEVAENCTVQGSNPRTVTVPFDDVVATTFDVVCEASVGDLEVSTTTTGDDLPGGYTVEVDGTQSQAVKPNDVVIFSDLAEGDHTVELTDVAANCTVTGANPRTVSVPFGGTGTTTFEVTCEKFGTIVFDSDRDGNREIYSMRPDGSDQTRITNDPATDMHPALSPDGTKIAFDSDRDGSTDIYVMNRDGTGVVQLTNSGTNFASAWSPDGSQIAFTRIFSGQRDVWLMNADGSNLRNLTDNPANDGNPTWSPDGTEVVFDSERDGNREIYVINVNGTGATRLTNDPAFDASPAWSPDGARIAFVSDRQGTQDVWLMNADGTNPVNLTNSSAVDGGPAWSPLGSTIAFYSDRDGDFEIYLIEDDGTNLRARTNNTADDRRPDWSQ